MNSDTRIILPQGRITSRYGYRKHPITRKTHFHNGIDIALKEGTPIQAPESGTIENVYYDNRGGFQLILRGQKYIYGFAHLKKILVRKGEVVTKGQIIAESGKSGSVTGAHLHFTVKTLEGKYIDPETLYA
jgi:murein DD-endopeptidase MepM/ murein hydrolase activator NlpD